MEGAAPFRPFAFHGSQPDRELCSVDCEDLAQIVRRLIDGAAHGWRLGDRVQQHEVVDGAVVADRLDRHTSRRQLSGKRLALVAQDVVLIDDEQRLRQPLELLGAGVDGRNMDVGAFATSGRY